MGEEKKSMLAAGIAYSIFGFSFLFSKMALNITEPMILLCVRFSVTFIVLNLLAFTKVLKLELKGKNLAGPIILGLLQPVAYFVLENYGLKYTTTSFTGIISSMSPIFTAVMGIIFLKEKPNLKQWLCITLTIIGVLMVSLGSENGENTLAGCICLLAAYFLGSFYSVFVRKLSKKFSPMELTYVMFAVGFVFFLGMAFVTHSKETVPMVISAIGNTEFIIAVLYLGIAASIVAYMLANYSLSRLPVTRSTIFSCFSTIVSVASGVVIMKDPFTVTSAIAFVLILFGVFGVNHFAAKKTDAIEK
ncbi:MAG: DMT family transporter [Ruminococcaceae bacterium]|nr:DMT family transporter [Oscillospiraceae bacterium]